MVFAVDFAGVFLDLAVPAADFVALFPVLVTLAADLAAVLIPVPLAEDLVRAAFVLPAAAVGLGFACDFFLEVFDESVPSVLRLLVVIEYLQSIKVHSLPKR